MGKHKKVIAMWGYQKSNDSEIYGPKVRVISEDGSLYVELRKNKKWERIEAPATPKTLGIYEKILVMLLRDIVHERVKISYPEEEAFDDEKIESIHFEQILRNQKRISKTSKKRKIGIYEGDGYHETLIGEVDPAKMNLIRLLFPWLQ